MAKKEMDKFFMLKLSLGLLFVATGLLGITHYNSAGAEFMRGVNNFLGRSNDVLPIIMSILELIAGVIMLVSLFSLIPEKTTGILMLVILIYWGVRIIMSYFVNDIFEPDFITWLGRVTPHLVILAGLWTVFQGESK